jgi:predicted signal transduction protein with EAL and GGDEF domain
VRPEDVPCRLGGDEFAVLVAARGERISDLAQRIHDAIAEPIPLGGLDLRVTCSIGVATGNSAEVTVDELLRNADVAMYAAKTAGAGGVEHFVPGMPSRFSESMALRAALRRALTIQGRGGIEVHYQPVVELGTERVLSVEALARWTDPVRGEVPPEVFVAAAEGDDLITDVGTAVMRRATSDIAALLASGLVLDLAVNVSFRELARASFVPSVVAASQAAGFPLTRLILEITESTLLDESDIVAQRLGELRALGVRIAFDDFGTGYSSLAHLRWSPADSLKIDRSFVHGVTGGGADPALVHAMIQLGRDLSLTVVAEGVETQVQADHLRELGCQQAQGYLFGRPMPIEQLGARLNQPVG